MSEEHSSVKEMWESYLATLDNRAEVEERGYDAWHFCYEKKDADELAELTLNGVKRATASLNYWYESGEEPRPEVGEHDIITDYEGVARCICKTTSIEIVPFKDVTEEFAATEGEGDGSLDYWKRGHERFFREELEELGKEFSEDILVLCQRFEKVFPK